MAVNQFISPDAKASHLQMEAPGDGSPIQIADAALLFKGDYSRSGNDLEISGSAGKSITIEGYFDSGSASALVGPNGAMLSGDVVEALAGPLFPGQYAQAGGTGQSGNPIGEVQHLEGTATATRTDGSVVQLEPGTKVYLGDVVETGSNTKFGLSLEDGSLFSMTSDARMVLNEFVFNGDQAQDSSMLVNLVQGAFVFVAGSIAPTGNMKVETPVAVLAIRGTTIGADIDNDLGSTQVSLFKDVDKDYTGSFVVLDKSGKIIGTVTEVGNKLIITGVGEVPIIVQKTDQDDQNDQAALDLIKTVFAKAAGQQGELDGGSGSGSFEGIQIVALGQTLTLEDLAGNPLAAASAAKVVIDTLDKDDPPVAFFDGFLTEEDDIFFGNVISNTSIQPDEDPEGFDVRVVGFGEDLIWEEGVDYAFDGSIVSTTGSTTFVLTSGAVVEINSAGDFTYNPNPAFDYLAEGESAVDSFTYLIADPGNFTDSDTVEVTIIGDNDRPVVVSIDAQHQDAITETPAVQDSPIDLVASGTVMFEDLDSTDAHDNATTNTPVFDSAVWNRIGLPAETYGEIFGRMELTLTESPSLTPDPAASPNPGEVAWQFTIADQDIDFLGAGETLVIDYIVNVKDDSGNGATDSTSQVVTVTITGTNDVPLIDVTASVRDLDGTIDEIADLSTSPPELGTNLVESGTVTFTDVDLSDAHIATISTNPLLTKVASSTAPLTATQTAALLNAFTIQTGTSDEVTSFDSSFVSPTAGDGTVGWTYSIPDQAIDFLGDGDVVELEFVVEIDDGNGGTVTETVFVTVNGTNDAPVIDTDAGTRDVVGSVDEIVDGATGENVDSVSTDGVIAFADVDLSDAHTATISTNPLLTKVASSTAPLTATQTAALLNAFTIQTGTSDEVTSFESNGDATTAGDGTVGWTYSIPDQAIDFLGDGDVVELEFVVEIDDGNGGTVTETVFVTVNGTNDAPVIDTDAGTRDVVGSVDEIVDGATGENVDSVSTDGVIAFADVDLSDAHTATISTNPLLTKVASSTAPLTATQTAALLNAFTIQTGTSDEVTSFESNGDATTAGDGTVGWTYSIPDQAIDFLGDGDVVELEFVVEIDDGNGGTVTETVFVTVNGTNDAPVIDTDAGTRDVVGSVDEIVDGATGENVDSVSTDGVIAFADVDLSDAHTATISTNPLLTKVASSTAPLTATQTAALLNAFTIQTGTSDEVTSFESNGDATTAGDGTVGWTYSIPDQAIDFLGDGDVVELEFVVEIDDGNGGTVTETVFVTVNGTNDAPTLAAVTAGSIVEDDQASTTTDSGLTGMLAGADVDNATLTYGITDGVAGIDGDVGYVLKDGTYGTLKVNTETGAYEYVKNVPAIEALTAGDAATDNFTMTVSDDDGPAVGQTYTVNLTGADEVSVAAATITFVADPGLDGTEAYGGPVLFGTEDPDVFYVDNYGGYYSGGYDYSFLDSGEPVLIANFDPGEDLLYIDYIDYIGYQYYEGYSYYAVSVDPLNAVLIQDDFNTTVNVSTGEGTTDLVLLEGATDGVSLLEPDPNILQYDSNDISNAIPVYDGGGEVFLGVDGQADTFMVFATPEDDPAIILNFEPDQDVLYLDYLLSYDFSGDVQLDDDGTDTTVQVQTDVEGVETYIDLVTLENVTGMGINIVAPPE